MNTMWNIGSTTASITQMFTDIGTVMTLVIPAVLAVLIALLGLGFAVRHLKKYVTGRKF